MKQVVALVCFILLAGSALGQELTASASVKANPSGRILNGTPASIEKYPFILQLRFFNFFICAASIITVNQAITSANCLIFGLDPGFLSLVGGTSNLSSGGITFAVSSFVIHPDYVAPVKDYDVAIITIVDSFEGYDNIAAIPLQTIELTYSSTNPTWCTALGWGNTSRDNEPYSEDLRSTWLQPISQPSCAKQWAPFEITTRMLCAQLPRTQTCSGDLGGPLVCNGQLVGIISYNDQFCNGVKPSIFVRLSSSKIRAFIREVTDI